MHQQNTIAQNRAFTLIELLVVIAIIALLVSILLPSLTKAKQIARFAVCASNQHSLGSTVHVYATDHNGYTPPIANLYAQDQLKTGLSGTGSDEYINQASGLGALVEAGLLDRGNTVFDLFWCPSVETRSGASKDLFLERFIKNGGWQGITYITRYFDGTYITSVVSSWWASPCVFELATCSNMAWMSDAFIGDPDNPHEGRWNVWYLDGHVQANTLIQDWLPMNMLDTASISDLWKELDN